MISAVSFEADKACDAPDWRGRVEKLDASTLLWIDVDPTSDDARELSRALGLSAESARRLESLPPSAFFGDFGSYLHLTFLVPTTESEQAASSSTVDCLVGDNWILTAHHERVEVLEDFAALAEGSGDVGLLHGPVLLATLFEWVLYEYVRAFETIEDRLEAYDVDAMSDPPTDSKAEMRHLVGLRRDVGTLRRALMTHQRALAALAHPELQALANEESAERFSRVLDLFDNTVDGARDVRDQVIGSFDILLARTGERTNEIVKVLTITSVMLLPGSALAGIMGMNYKVGLFTHPEYFWVVVGVAIAVAAATVIAARWWRWI
jgi:Mg2+ and Co2+ transporter CorA